MKYLGLLLLVVVLFSSSVSAQVIANTKHGFQNASWNAGGQICQPCHTPHAAKLSSNALWNHQASPNNYSTWESEEVGEVSKNCLDCHDGQIALAAFGGTTDASIPNGSHMNGGTVGLSNLGVDLTNDHPINFAWNTTTTVSGQTVNKPNVFEKNGTKYVGGTSGDLRLTKHADNDYRVDCTTCHTPHGKAGVGFLLRKANTASVLCQDCHNK